MTAKELIALNKRIKEMKVGRGFVAAFEALNPPLEIYNGGTGLEFDAFAPFNTAKVTTEDGQRYSVTAT